MLAQNGLRRARAPRSSTSRWSTRWRCRRSATSSGRSGRRPVAARSAAAGQGAEDDPRSSSDCASIRTRCGKRTPTTHPTRLRCSSAISRPPRALRRNTFPVGMVFTCLSHDIIAHETTHALLDGMHRRYIEPDQSRRPRLPRGLRRHRFAAPALHVSGDPAAPDRLHPRRASHRGKPARSAGRAVRARARAARGVARRHRHDRSADRRVDAPPAGSAGLPDHVHPARARRDPGRRGLRRVPEHLRTAHRRPDPDRDRRHRTSRRGAIHPDLVGRLAEEAAAPHSTS